LRREIDHRKNGLSGDKPWRGDKYFLSLSNKTAIDNKEIVAIISDYLKLLNDGNNNKIYQLLIYENTTEVQLILTVATFISEIRNRLPTGYFVLDNEYIYVYSGIDYFCKIDSSVYEKCSMACPLIPFIRIAKTEL
jgi:hypothetical protein